MKIFFSILLVMLSLICLGQINKFKILNNELTLEKSDIEFYNKTLPNSFDLSGSPYWPNLFKQKDWVCNQVAASYYMFSYEYNSKNKINSKNPFNCYSIYFPFNFGNGGFGWYGEHYISTMEILKKFGMPKYGECIYDTLINVSKWMNSYDSYYSAMHNKIDDYFGIRVNSADGITALKAWVYNHGGGEYGGTATFMANIADNGSTHLPKGSAHQGDYAMVICGDNALHARTIVGFDDNICFDYNGDGKFTNNIDINGDGIVDVHDWEKGGFKLAEANGPNWQGEGYMWITYKAMADRYRQGGILNNLVHVIIPKFDYKPKFTVKFRIKHVLRERIKISVGITKNIEEDTWEYLADFPIFNYQGGPLYMQGGNSEEDKIIEVGLDLTSLLSKFNDDNCAKLFFVVDECDNTNSYPGSIEYCSFIDYSKSTPNEIVIINESLNFANNSRTVISKIVCLDEIIKPEIYNLNLPILSASSNNWFQFDFFKGEGDNKWKLLPYFDTIITQQKFETLQGTKLTPNENFDASVDLTLPYIFNFGKIKTNRINISANGYILPYSESDPWTQFRENLYPMFLNENIIAPLARFNFISNPEYEHGIWYKFVGDTVKIQWKLAEKYAETTSYANFQCNLISNGDIEFLYGDILLKNIYTNLCGISYGNQDDNILLWKDNDIPKKNTLIKIKQFPIPENLNISDYGALYGKLPILNDYPVQVKISDSNDNYDSKTYLITTIIDESDNEDEDIRVYPNPVHNVLNVNLLKDDLLISNIFIYDINGKLINSKKDINQREYKINLEDFPQGIYNIKIESKNFVFNRRFVKL